MKITINAISAKRGGAATYLQNVLPELLVQLGGTEENRIAVWRGVATTADDGRWPGGIEYRQDLAASGGAGATGGTIRRLWFDQVQLPRMLQADGSEVLFSSANFGPLRCPCRQVLLVRNPIYFDPTFMSRMKSPKVRAYYFFQRWLTLRCAEVSDVVLFPTQAMLELVARHTRGERHNWRVAHYGTRHDLFFPTDSAGPSGGSTVSLLNVSLYSDQKNFGTLLGALKLLQQAASGRYTLRLTAGFNQDWMGQSAYFPNFRHEQSHYAELNAAGVANDVDWKTYGTLPDFYRSADIFVFPSYTESFGHPLVEAMASGLPIVAADVPVNRELCGEAAVYFSPFDTEACAKTIRQVAEDSEIRHRLQAAAIKRAQSFTWQRHVERLLDAFQGGK